MKSTKVDWQSAESPPKINLGTKISVILQLKNGEILGGWYLNNYPLRLDTNDDIEPMTGFSVLHPHDRYDDFYFMLEETEPLYWAPMPDK